MLFIAAFVSSYQILGNLKTTITYIQLKFRITLPIPHKALF